MPKVIQVIESYETRGAGVVGDVVRNVRRYYTLDGEFLAEYDPAPSRRDPEINMGSAPMTPSDSGSPPSSAGTPTDTEMWDWLEREQCSLTCWRVPHPDSPAGKDNGWTVSDDGDDEDGQEAQGNTAREAVTWAIKLHRQGKLVTRRDHLLREIGR